VLRSAPSPLFATTEALCLTLLDIDTRVWIDPAARTTEILTHLGFHCGCPIVDEAAQAQFALITNPASMPGLASFDQGTDAYPDRSATIIIQVDSIENGDALFVSGPGVADQTRLYVTGLPPFFPAMWQTNRTLYPQGVDVIFTDPRHLIGLPRTCKVEV
jgi:alpha-D-ribose 1-methylphosphonate 5-triphosphate synthase subunit PhnH